MAKTTFRYVRPRLFLAFAFALGSVLVFWPARTVRSDDFVFYLPSAHQVLPVEVVGNTKYLPLIQVLNLVGKVTGIQEKRSSLQVYFGKSQLEFRADNKRLRVNREQFTLSDPVRNSNGQWMVPVDFLTRVLPALTRNTVTYQAGTSRVFIGDVQPSSFTVRLDQLTNGARLTLQFSDKVTVRTAAKNGMWVMFLGERPVQPLEQTFQFHDPYVRELRFDDQDGVPKLILTPSQGGLDFYPVLAEGGKVLLADVLKPPPAAPEQARTPAQATAPQELAPAATEEFPAAQPGPPLPVVILDAGHGGNDAGARSREGLLEKDLVAQLVGRVRITLLGTKKYRILLTRVGDANPTFEQREVAVNLARPAVFLTFHAGNLGPGGPRIAIFIYRPSSPVDPPGPGALKGAFIPWTIIQGRHLARSRQLAEVLEQRLGEISGVSAETPEGAPVRVLRSVDAPAVAIELGSLSPDASAGALAIPEFQQQVAAAIAQALEDFQTKQS